MDNFNTGDLVVLSCGSMRMAVETVEDSKVSCVWCHEGIIGRDTFNAKLLRKWENREDGGARRDAGKPFRGDRDGGAKPFRGGDRDDRPKGKPGWDGKPREKKFFRKED